MKKENEVICQAYVFRRVGNDRKQDIAVVEIANDLDPAIKLKVVRDLIREYNGDGGGIRHISDTVV